jgi:hypothetical protein
VATRLSFSDSPFATRRPGVRIPSRPPTSLQAQQLTQPCEIRSVGRVGHFSDFCVLEAKIPCLLCLPIRISIRAASEAFCKPRTREFWRVQTRRVKSNNGSRWMKRSAALPGCAVRSRPVNNIAARSVGTYIEAETSPWDAALCREKLITIVAGR